ncbi:MAG: ribosome biogenesis factor YjgA [Pseudomonadota bacterium]
MKQHTDPPQDDDELIIISKSQQKREAHALTDLGKAMIDMSAGDLEKIPLSDDLKKAILAAQSMKKGALKRQTQYIGKQLRKTDTEAIEKAVEDIQHARTSSGRAFKQLELWRKRLLEEGNEALTAFCAEYPGADVQRLRQLIRNAQKEQSQGKPPKSFRELFQLIRDIAGEND